MSKIEEVGVPRELVEEAIKELEETLVEIGGCDHSVGICCYSIYMIVGGLKRCLETPTPNPNKVGKP